MKLWYQCLIIQILVEPIKDYNDGFVALTSAVYPSENVAICVSVNLSLTPRVTIGGLICRFPIGPLSSVFDLWSEGLRTSVTQTTTEQRPRLEIVWTPQCSIEYSYFTRS